MAYNKFNFNISVRIILIVINCYFLISEYILREYIITVANLAVLLALQTFFLIKYIQKTNLKIIEYFDLIKNKESGFRLTNIKDKNSFSLLRRKFDETNQIIQDIKIDKEVQSNYLNHIVNYINMGLFSFDENDKIQFINPEAKKILGINNIFKLDDLNILNKDFSAYLKNIQPNQSEIIEISNPSITQKISINCGLFNLRDSTIKLISFQNIDKHLYKTEIESWNKLIRILNHEIMNSITPITSLSKTIKNYFVTGENIARPENITSQAISRTVEGLGIIEERGKGLINFVNNYRKLSNLPHPNKTNICLYELFNHIRNLFQDENTNPYPTQITTECPENLILNTDKDHLSQILINLIKNSLEALKRQKEGQIKLAANKTDASIQIKVSDNGDGIPKEIINEIFIPFFTTKDSGSGIGLSISKQLMEMNDGSISVSAAANHSTVFTITFNNQ